MWPDAQQAHVAPVSSTRSTDYSERFLTDGEQIYTNLTSQVSDKSEQWLQYLMELAVKCWGFVLPKLLIEAVRGIVHYQAGTGPGYSPSEGVKTWQSQTHLYSLIIVPARVTFTGRR